MTFRKLRFGVICQGNTVAKWQADCIKSLIEHEFSEPALLVIFDAPKPRRPNARHFLFHLYNKSWVRNRSKALRPIAIDDQLGDVPKKHCTVSRAGPDSINMTSEDVEAVREHRLDFLLYLGSTQLGGDILEAAKCGIWSYQFDFTTILDKGSARVTERPEGPPVVKAILKTLSAARGKAVILYQGFFGIRNAYVDTLDTVYFGCSDWCLNVCNQIRMNDGETFNISASPITEHIKQGFSNWQMLALLIRQTTWIISELFTNLFFLRIWNIGVVDARIEDIVKSGRAAPVRWLPEASNHRYYYADPFALPGSDNLVILFERYDYVSAKGRIEATTIPEAFDGAPNSTAIELPVHLSYPYLLKSNDQIFCVPESHEANVCTLYRAVEFPTHWQPVRTLIDGFAAVDPTVFQFGRYFWLFCTDAKTGPDQKLYAWYADKLLGTWSPHPLNPLKCDVRSSRPAGSPFEMEGSFYRPAQDCSQEYGGAITLNRIIRLDPTGFLEEPVSQIKPDPAGQYSDGLHTICSVRNLTIIDGRRKKFAPLSAIIKFRRRQSLKTRQLKLRKYISDNDS